MIPALIYTALQHDLTLVEAFIAYAAGGPNLIQGFIMMPLTWVLAAMI